jgi:hypothetical protein
VCFWLRVRRGRLERGRHQFVRVVDSDATEARYAVASVGGDGDGSASEGVELSTIATESETGGPRPRYTDKAEEILDNYDEAMMQAVRLDAPPPPKNAKSPQI